MQRVNRVGEPPLRCILEEWVLREYTGPTLIGNWDVHLYREDAGIRTTVVALGYAYAFTMAYVNGAGPGRVIAHSAVKLTDLPILMRVLEDAIYSYASDPLV